MNISVRSPAEAAIILGFIRDKLSDWRKLWPIIERDLPEIQEAYFDARFYQALTHSPGTIDERKAALGSPVREARRRKALARGRGYYFENRPGSRASADHPYYEWTGSLRRATQRMTLRDATKAAIDTERSYRGPLSRVFRDPVESIMATGKNRVEPFDVRAIDQRLDPAIEEWLENVVLKEGVI